MAPAFVIMHLETQHLNAALNSPLAPQQSAHFFWWLLVLYNSVHCKADGLHVTCYLWWPGVACGRQLLLQSLQKARHFYARCRSAQCTNASSGRVHDCYCMLPSWRWRCTFLQHSHIKSSLSPHRMHRNTTHQALLRCRWRVHLPSQSLLQQQYPSHSWCQGRLCVHLGG